MDRNIDYVRSTVRLDPSQDQFTIVPISSTATRNLVTPQSGALPRVIVAMLGARRHYAVPRLLQEAGHLERFFTDGYIGNKLWLETMLNIFPSTKRPAVIQRLLGRKEDAIPAKKVTSFDWLGLWYARAHRSATEAGSVEVIYGEAARRFAENIRKHGLGDGNVLWGCNDASLELFEYAKQSGIHCILDQISNPKPLQQVLAEEEYARWHGWVPSAERCIRKSSLEAREREEWRVADTVVAGSPFVERGLIECGVPAHKIRVVPSGVDLRRFAPAARAAFGGPRPLRVLFVGRVSIMKGVPYLLQALNELGPKVVQARFVGGIHLNREKLIAFSDVGNFTGHIPRHSLPEEYRWADVFCFPSISEGSADVTYEALASGLPVITTPNSGSIVQNDVDGFIVPIRDPDALAETIGRYASNRELLAQHQAATLQRRERAGLDRYKADLVSAIRDICRSEACREHPSGEFQ